MIWIYTILGFIVFAVLRNKLRRWYYHKNAIGQRVKIEYADQNDTYDTILPIDATIEREIKVENIVLHILKLEMPIKGRSRIVVQERHVGNYIGSRNKIDVHLFTPKILLSESNIVHSFEELEHEVWVTVKPI